MRKSARGTTQTIRSRASRSSSGALLLQGRARDLALPMAKQGGRWYVDDAELLLRLPVAYAAPQECSAPEG